MTQSDYLRRQALIDALQNVRLRLLSEEEHERAHAQKRLFAGNYDSSQVMKDERYARIQPAAEAFHHAVGHLVAVLKAKP